MVSLTLEDIAKKAGVSRSTVSRVINDKPNVRPEVRQRVLSIIRETGYQPHAAARSLASHRSRLIGLVIPRSVHTVFTDPYFPRLTLGIAQACNQYDYTLSLFLLHTQDEEQRLYPRIARKGLLDGVIAQVGQMGDELICKMARAEIPFVVAGRPVNVPEASYVDVDNVAGSYNAVSHLIHLGYARIATITGPLTTTTGLDRLQGYRNALSRRGLAVNDHLVAEGDFTETGAYYATQRLIEHGPDAIFVASDAMALGALRALRDANLAVPDDIAIVSFDDLPPAVTADPPLTTVRQPIRRMGLKLVETLLDIIENGYLPPRRIVFDTELVIRASCGSKANARG
jgi:LacI family transcriptional regulator